MIFKKYRQFLDQFSINENLDKAKKYMKDRYVLTTAANQLDIIDPETKLHEFSVGPVSNRHAGGWKPDDYRPEIHQYMRVAGGYLEIELTYSGSTSQLSLVHLDPYGKEQHKHQVGE